MSNKKTVIVARTIATGFIKPEDTSLFLIKYGHLNP